MQLLQEEVDNEQSEYEKFIQTGHSILDKCDPDSGDATAITAKVSPYVKHGVLTAHPLL